MKKPTILPGSLFIETESYSLIAVCDWYYCDYLDEIVYRSGVISNIMRDNKNITSMKLSICYEFPESDFINYLPIYDDNIIKYINEHLDEIDKSNALHKAFNSYKLSKKIGFDRAWYNKFISPGDILDTKDGGFVIATSAIYNEDTNVYDCEGIVLSNIKYNDREQIESANISNPKKIKYEEIQSYIGRYYLVDEFIKNNKIGWE